MSGLFIWDVAKLQRRGESRQQLTAFLIRRVATRSSHSQAATLLKLPAARDLTYFARVDTLVAGANCNAAKACYSSKLCYVTRGDAFISRATSGVERRGMAMNTMATAPSTQQ